ncbi:MULTISPECIES: gamma-glutamyl-gamma-aminobutyrate hydrolase family protein [unclassified Mycolicibacterium]|uniref:gamma-glutamyl-gamma-aminobutyrate hydrolase family protein n=1 Tax=unclassified Mycolicibacterium TaxID=2636767 RepID=UPI002ED97943
MVKPVIAVTLSSRELADMVYWRRMFDGLQECGAIAFAVDCGTAPLNMSALLEHVDGLLISGGVDVDPTLHGADPNDSKMGPINVIRDRNEMAAVEYAWRCGIPTLAICRGAQLVNAARGGTLYVDLPRDRPSDVRHRRSEEELATTAHNVDVEAGSRLAGWLGESGRFAVNSQHHQGIRTLAPAFVTSAFADDGLIEAYEAADRPLSAVQWHPEIDWPENKASRRLLEGFVGSCRGVQPWHAASVR